MLVELAADDATFGELLEQWFEMRAPDWSPKTVVEHRRFIDKVIGPALGSTPLRKLRSEDLDRLYAADPLDGGDHLAVGHGLAERAWLERKRVGQRRAHALEHHGPFVIWAHDDQGLDRERPSDVRIGLEPQVGVRGRVQSLP